MFIKEAKIELISLASGGYNNGTPQFVKTAGKKVASIYGDSPIKINIQAMLDLVAKEYNISSDPNDYLFEAARAVTADEPNFNGDSFPRSELLRFDHRLGKAVYQSFIGKPNHLNHRADNPKTSRGVVLDASYNDLTPVLDECPGCGAKTASLEARDSSGLRCTQCDHVVKDEFVELLIAIDASKDSAYANGVRNGSLNSLSMGCFLAGTKITLSDGTTKPIESINVGDLVLTHTGSIASVKELSKRNYKGLTYTFKVAGLPESITATAEHPIWSPDLEWIHAAHLDDGITTLSPRLNSSISSNEDTKFARVVGFFTAEGSYIYGYDKSNLGERLGLEWSFGLGEDTYADEICSYLGSLGYVANKYQRSDRSGLVVKSYRCKELTNKIYNLVGEYCSQKKLSSEIFNWSRECQLNFIGAWIDGDGTYSSHGKRTNKHITVTTISEHLQSQLSQLLTNLNIPHSLQIRKDTSGFGSNKPALDIVIRGDWQTVFNKVSSKVNRSKLGSWSLTKQSNEGIIRPITEVSEQYYDGDVYNFEVDHSDHSYVAGGIAVHNCEAEYTDCSICENRARTTSQFCKHIKSGNKKKIFKTASGKSRMSYEKCGGVVFTEISRVDQPADPKALQSEIFTLHSTTPKADMFSFASRMASIESKLLKGAQLVNDDASLLEQIEELKPTHPELYRNLKKMIEPEATDVPDPISIDDYEKKHEESMNKGMSSAEMGIKDEMGGKLPTTIASKVKAGFDRLLGRNIIVPEEVKVNTPTLKFAKSYQDLEVAVTEKGNVRVFTPKGALFIVRPETKPGNAKSAHILATEVLTHIAENGLVDTVQKYNVVMSPHLAQVLQHHIEDFDGGREEGDKRSVSEGGIDFANGHEKPAKNLQEDADRDHQLKLDTPAKSVTIDITLDHAEEPKPAKSVLDKDIDDMDKARAKPSKDTLKDITLDVQDKKPKTGAKTAALPPEFLEKQKEKKDGEEEPEKKEAQMAPAPAPATPAAAPASPVAPAGGVAAEKCARHGRPDCKDAECAKTGISPEICPEVCPTCGSPMPPVESTEDGPTMEQLQKAKELATDSGDFEGEPGLTAARKYVSRMNRLYKGRIDKVNAEASSKVASAEQTAVKQLQDKFLRGLKLAAKRQALNLETSPLKAKMFDVLASKMDLDADTFYPGMDGYTASRIVEAATAAAFDEFIESLVKRAAQFVGMNEEALKSIEADIKNLQPAPISVPTNTSKTASREDLKQAAVNGNLIVAPAPTSEIVSNGGKRDNIRSALDTTKVRRTSQALLK